MTLSYDDLFLSENHRVALGFPNHGFVFLRVAARDSFSYMYDRVLTAAQPSTAGQIGANEFLSAFQLLNALGDSILEVRKEKHIYHLFYGIAPSALRTYLYVPTQTARRSPDVETIVTRARWGYIDGFESGFTNPSPRTELFLPFGKNLFGLAIWNPLTVAITDPLLWFLGYRYDVTVIKNASQIQQMLAGNLPVRFATVGGVTDDVSYDPIKTWGVDYVTQDMNGQEIANALRGGR